MKTTISAGWLGAFLSAFMLIAAAPAGASEHVNPLMIPESLILQTLQKDYDPVVFDHKTHVDKSKGCASCHHHSSAEETRKCAECHDLKKMAIRESLVESFISCKACHRKYSPDSPSMPGLLTAFHMQCFSCHKTEGPESCKKTCHVKAQAGKEP